MTKITMLAPANVNHTHKWAHNLAGRGYQIHLITQHPAAESYNESIKITQLPFRGTKGYFLNAAKVKALLSAEDPGIVHAHYASGYGTLAALSVKQPYLLSVWGSDVYLFPYRSWLHRQWIDFSLKRASHIASTSHAMADQVISLIGPRDIDVTPFGVNIESFHTRRPAFSNDTITIGTAKKLEWRYGVDVLIQSFKLLLEQVDQQTFNRLRLRLIGEGSKRNELQQLASQLGVGKKVEFVGAVSSTEVVNELEKIDIVVLSSRVESFGVSAIEALAARRPTIAADVGGLPEIIKHEQTGLLCAPDKPAQFAGAILRYISDNHFAKNLAEQGYKFASETYSEAATTDTMCETLELFRKNKCNNL
ncbi:glycosyltransferase [Idiomarina seosinensis]|uniref:glycosyltransferase n=1 Tax=Idiomarina seosinensis TaxID=281739 RepID=UPI00384D0CD8